MLLAYFDLRDKSLRLASEDRAALKHSPLLPAISVLAPVFIEASTIRALWIIALKPGPMGYRERTVSSSRCQPSHEASIRRRRNFSGTIPIYSVYGITEDNWEVGIIRALTPTT